MELMDHRIKIICDSLIAITKMTNDKHFFLCPEISLKKVPLVSSVNIFSKMVSQPRVKECLSYTHYIFVIKTNFILLEYQRLIFSTSLLDDMKLSTDYPLPN